MEKAPLVARVFHLFLILPDFDPNASGIPDFGHSLHQYVQALGLRRYSIVPYVQHCRFLLSFHQ